VAVLLATRWIILGTSRRALFDEIERPALKPLPVEPYTFAQWKECRAGLDYHVEVEKHYYSVPHQLLREKLWARITTRTVELFHNGKRIATHLRSSSDRKHTTVREHMLSSHQRYADWTLERPKRQAGKIGRNTATLVELILTEKTHPEQGSVPSQRVTVTVPYDIRFWVRGLVTQERASLISGPPATRRSGSLRFVRPAANEKGGRSRPTPSGLPGTAWAAAEGSRLPGR
jgi:hypothetical protein